MTAEALPLADVPEWELRERARLEASRCPDPECAALPPNHVPGCSLQKLPDPSAEPCPRCEFPAGSLGCRLGHRGDAA